MSKRWRNKFLALIYTSVTWFRKRNLWTLYSENEIIGEKIWDVLRSKKKSNKRPYSERGSAKWLIKKKYTNLKESGNFFENFFAVWKSLTRSRHSHAGSLQSGLPGHHSRWWRDCMVPRGSLTSSSTCTPSLQNHKPIIVSWFHPIHLRLPILLNHTSCILSFCTHIVMENKIKLLKHKFIKEIYGSKIL